MSHVPSLQSRVVRLDNARYTGGARLWRDIDLIVLHCTAGDSARSSMDWMNRSGSTNKTSYHYIVDRNGIIYRMCAPLLTAYHAGDSAYPAHPESNHQGTSVNRRSLGIAWANRNDGEPLTEKQIESGLWLCALYCRGTNTSIPIDRVVGHCEVSPGRKSDPRPAMDMDTWREKLAEYLTI